MTAKSERPLTHLPFRQRMATAAVPVCLLAGIGTLTACGDGGSLLSTSTPSASAWPPAGNPCSLVTTATVSEILGQPMRMNPGVEEQECVWFPTTHNIVPDVSMRMVDTRDFDAAHTASPVVFTMEPQTIPGFDAAFVKRGDRIATVYARRGAMALHVEVTLASGDSGSMAVQIVTAIGRTFSPTPKVG